ncbi:cbb3-type cytochrome c oxidase subunit I [Kribbella pratensis]|uniref:cbb3-type cytochrome c oxidase subunit I n=1 Tax=Kribbella pratensis TaxID=2512112 RepID=UPI001065AA65
MAQRVRDRAAPVRRRPSPRAAAHRISPRATAHDPPRIATGSKLHLWRLFIGFHTTFLVQHWLGVEGMPRRSADYSPRGEFTVLHQVFWVGELIRGISSLPLFHNLYKCRKSPRVEIDDPGDLRGLDCATLDGPSQSVHPGPREQRWGDYGGCVLPLGTAALSGVGL